MYNKLKILSVFCLLSSIFYPSFCVFAGGNKGKASYFELNVDEDIKSSRVTTYRRSRLLKQCVECGNPQGESMWSYRRFSISKPYCLCLHRCHKNSACKEETGKIHLGKYQKREVTHSGTDRVYVGTQTRQIKKQGSSGYGYYSAYNNGSYLGLRQAPAGTEIKKYRDGAYIGSETVGSHYGSTSTTYETVTESVYQNVTSTRTSLISVPIYQDTLCECNTCECNQCANNTSRYILYKCYNCTITGAPRWASPPTDHGDKCCNYLFCGLPSVFGMFSDRLYINGTLVSPKDFSPDTNITWSNEAATPKELAKQNRKPRIDQFRLWQDKNGPVYISWSSTRRPEIDKTPARFKDEMRFYGCEEAKEYYAKRRILKDVPIE